MLKNIEVVHMQIYVHNIYDSYWLHKGHVHV